MAGDDLVVTLRGAASGPELMAVIATLLEHKECAAHPASHYFPRLPFRLTRLVVAQAGGGDRRQSAADAAVGGAVADV